MKGGSYRESHTQEPLKITVVIKNHYKMNLGQVYRVLTLALPNLKVTYYEYKEKEKSFDYLFADLDSFNQAYNLVQKFAPFLVDDKTSNHLQPVLRRENNYSSLTTDIKVGQSIVTSVNYLKESVNRYLAYIEPFVLANTHENSIDVKFVHITDLDELEKTINQLKRALNNPVFELEGRIEVQKVDSGSIYITLLVIGAFANQILKMVANLIWAAVAIKNKSHQNKLFIEHARTMELKNDMLELIINQAKSSIENSKESEAQHIVNEFLPNKNTPDNVNNFKGSLEMFDSLLEKGAEFYPSVKAPEEVKQLFPDFNIKELIESKLKLLDEGNVDKN